MRATGGPLLLVLSLVCTWAIGPSETKVVDYAVLDEAAMIIFLLSNVACNSLAFLDVNRMSSCTKVMKVLGVKKQGLDHA